jgi:hypothetical protein
VPILDVKITQETYIPIIILFVHVGIVCVPLLLWWLHGWGNSGSWEAGIWDCSPMEAPELKLMLSCPASQVCHVFHKWIVSPSAMSAVIAISASSSLPAPLCITSTLVETASGVPVLVGEHYTLNWWDVEVRSCNRLGGTDVHGCYMLHDGRLIGRQLVDGSRHLGCNCQCSGGCICASACTSHGCHCCCHHGHCDSRLLLVSSLLSMARML